MMKILSMMNNGIIVVVVVGFIKILGRHRRHRVFCFTCQIWNVDPFCLPLMFRVCLKTMRMTQSEAPHGTGQQRHVIIETHTQHSNIIWKTKTIILFFFYSFKRERIYKRLGSMTSSIIILQKNTRKTTRNNKHTHKWKYIYSFE